MAATKHIDTPGGPVEFPGSMSDAEIEAVLRTEYGGPAPAAATPKAPAVAPDVYPPVKGGILDTLGLTTRPGARTPKDVLVEPQGVAEHLAQLGVTIPAITLGGEAAGLAGIPAAAGRIAASGAIGGATSALQGREPAQVFWDAFMDSALGVLGEVGGKAMLSAHVKIPGTGVDVPIGAEKIADPLTRARAGYAYYTKQIDEVMGRVRSRLPKGRWLTVPEIAPTGKITVDEAVAGLKRLEGKSYQIAREQLKNELNRLDIFRISGPKPYAGSIMKKFTSPERFQFPGTAAQRLASRVAPILGHPVTRGSIDAALIGSPETQDVLAGMGAGALEAPGALGRWITPRVGAEEPARIAPEDMAAMRSQEDAESKFKFTYSPRISEFNQGRWPAPEEMAARDAVIRDQVRKMKRENPKLYDRLPLLHEEATK